MVRLVSSHYNNLCIDRTSTLSPRQPTTKVRDFAYDQHDSEVNTRDFIANFADFGFESHYKRVNNGDLLSKAGFLGYEKVKLLRKSPADLKARFPGLFDADYQYPKCEEIAGTNTDSAYLDPTGTTDTSFLATKVIAEPSEEEVSNGRPRNLRNNELLLAVAACMVEYKR